MTAFIAEYQPWPKKVFQQFSPGNQEILLDSFRFNPMGWDLLFSETTFSRCVSYFEQRVSEWTALNIAFLNVIPEQIFQDCLGKPLSVFHQRSMDYVKTYANSENISNAALMLAFESVERLKIEKSEVIFDFLSIYGADDVSLNLYLWRNIFAIFDQLVEDPIRIYQDLLRNDPSNEVIDLVVSAILAQPALISEKMERFQRLIADLREEEAIGVIEFLHFRQVDSIAKDLAIDLLEKSDHYEIFRFQMTRVPFYRVQSYLQRINRYLSLCEIAGLLDEYQRGFEVFGERLLESGFAYELAGETQLWSLPLTAQQVSVILSSPDWDVWRKYLLKAPFSQNQKFEEVLGILFKILYDECIGPIMVQEKLNTVIGSGLDWFRYFHEILQKTLTHSHSVSLKQKLVEFGKSGAVDHGLSFFPHDLTFLDVHEQLHWKWLFVLRNSSTSVVLAQICSDYAKIQDWSGVIEVAELINSDRKLTKDGRLLLGKAYLELGEIEKSISLLREVLASDTKNPEANLYMGMGYARSGKHELAIAHLGRAASYDSKNPVIWLSLAQLHIELENNDLAIAILENGLQSLPDHPDLLYQLSVLYRNSGQKRLAHEVISKHIDAVISKPERLFSYMELLWEVEALTELQELVFGLGQEYLACEQVIFYRTKLHQFEGNLAAAIAELEYFLLNNVASKKAYDLYFSLLTGEPFVLGLALLDLEMVNIEVLKKITDIALQNFQEDSNYQLYYFEVQILSGHYQEAARGLRELALKSDENNREFVFRLEFAIALCARYSGELDIAMATLESLLHQNANQPSVLMQLAEVYLLDELFSQAEFHANRVLDLYPATQAVVDWYVQLIGAGKDRENVENLLWKMSELYPDSLPIKKLVVLKNLDHCQEQAAQENLSEIVKKDIGLSFNDRTELVRYALRCHSLDLTTRLIDGGGDMYRLPPLVLIQYLLVLMVERQFGLAILVIQENIPYNRDLQLLKIIEADCYFYIGQYEQTKQILLKLLGDTKNLRMANWDGFEAENFAGISFSKAELVFHQSPASVYLRLALACRAIGEIALFRSYCEKALAFNLKHPVTQYAFSLAVLLNGAADEQKKLRELLFHWGVSIQNDLGITDPYVAFRQNLIAQCMLAASENKKFQPPSSIEIDLSKVTAKYAYALRKSGAREDLDRRSVSELLNRFDAELQSVQAFSQEKGLASIFHHFFLDDLWFADEIRLDEPLMAIWPRGQRYYEQNHKLGYARELYCRNGLLLLLLNLFYSELLIEDHLPQRIVDLELVAKNIQQIFEEDNRHNFSRDVLELWQYYQATQLRSVMLVDGEYLSNLPDNIKAAFVFCARTTETRFTEDQLLKISHNASVDVMTQIALTYLQQGSKQKAWETIKQAMGRASSNAVVRFCYAKIAAELNEESSAIEGIQSALRLWPNESAWHRWAAKKLIEQEQLNEASMHLEYLEQNGVCFNSERIELAIAYIDQKALNKASRLIDQISADEENEKKRASLLLLLAARQGAFEQARKLFGEIVCEDDLSRDAYLSMAEMELDHGYQDGALRIVQKAYTFSPTHVPTLLLLAKSLIGCGYQQDAVKILSQVPRDAPACLQAQRLHLLQKAASDAVFEEEINVAFIAHPDNPDIRFLEAKKLVAEGNFTEARELLAGILQQEEVSAEHHFFAGQLHIELGNLDKAVTHLNMAIQKNSKNPEMLLLLANLHVKRRENHKALEVYQKGIQQFESDYRFYYESGRLLREMKLYGDAEFMFRRASEIVPNRRDIRNQLGAVMALNFVHSSR